MTDSIEGIQDRLSGLDLIPEPAVKSRSGQIRLLLAQAASSSGKSQSAVSADPAATAGAAASAWYGIIKIGPAKDHRAVEESSYADFRRRR